MQNRSKRYKLLIHCRVPQIREGFKLHLEGIDVDIHTKYTDLSQDGISSKLKFQPDLIIVLLSQSDEDMTLAIKLKMFAGDTALLWITPSIPDSYFFLLQTIGVKNIIQLPEEHDDICKKINNLLMNV